MLKQRDTRFLPQALTKQERRIDCDSQNRPGYRLRNVVMIGEFFGITLEMNLKTRVTRLHHDVVVCELQLVQSLNVNGEWTATHPDHASIQFMITRNRSEIVEGQVRLL